MFYIFIFSQQQLNYHNKSLIICQQIISDNFIKISFVFSFSKKQEPMVRISSDDIAWRRPTLTGGNPQLQSALRSLTSVFDMGTGVSFSLSPPHYYLIEWSYSFKTRFKVKVKVTLNSIFFFLVKSSID